jgi:hypothetical protein
MFNQIKHFIQFREMANKSAQENEKILKKLFQPPARFIFKEIEYESEISDKPMSQDGNGEPITDLYIQAKPTKEKVDNLILKISLKKTDWEFIKNHMQKSDAQELFFDDYDKNIKNYIERSYELLKDLPVVNLGWDGKIINNKLQLGGFTLGWEMMVTQKNRVESYGQLSEKYVNELVLGKHLQKNRRNAIVGGEEKKDSGIPTHVLTKNLDENSNFEEVFNEEVMLPIKKFKEKYQDRFYVILKANNYRSLRNDKTSKQRCDGSRPLFIQNRWFVKNGCLDRELICDFDKAFNRNDENRESLEGALEQLGMNIGDIKLEGIPLCKDVPENHE